MPDIFNLNCRDRNDTITVVCGDSISRSYNIEDAVEVVFQSPAFSYQIPLTQSGVEWNLYLSPQQTQIIEEGSYRYQIKARFNDGTVKTLDEDIINFVSSIFPLYKTYPVVVKDRCPETFDNVYAVPTLWYDNQNKSLWILESNVGRVATWKNLTSNEYPDNTLESKLNKDFSTYDEMTDLDGEDEIILKKVSEGSNMRMKFKDLVNKISNYCEIFDGGLFSNTAPKELIDGGFFLYNQTLEKLDFEVFISTVYDGGTF